VQSENGKVEATEVAAWLIWSGEYAMWWRENAQGYSAQVGGAGRYTRSDAEAYIAGCGLEKKLEIVPDPYGPEAENCTHAA